MADITEHYGSGYEDVRLESGSGQLERERTRELLERFLPLAPAVVLDIGGGTGAYAFWLASRGYQVHLLDVVPLHIDIARRLESEPSLAGLSAHLLAAARKA